MHALHWHDMLNLYQNRRQLLVLDHKLLLTHGNPLSPTALLQHLNPERDSFTGVSSTSDGEITLIGQIYRLSGEKAAHLSYLLPMTACSTSALPPLIEGFAKEVGTWGAFHMLVEVNERNMALGCFKRAGFTVYTWQNIWTVPKSNSRVENKHSWQLASPADEISINSLYHCLVPPLVQRAQQILQFGTHGYVYYKNHELLGYVEVSSGPRGIHILPLIHPEIEDVRPLLAELIDNIQTKSSRPIYLALRSYQSWLENVLLDLKLESSPRQALMVRYLTNALRSAIHSSTIPVIEGRKAETTTLLPNCSKDR